MTYEVKPIVLGQIAADMSGFTYMAFAGTPLVLEVTYFLIKGAEKNILFDTGSWAARMAKYWPGEGVDFQTFEESLEKEGLSTNDVDIIVTSHLHHDHVGNHFKCKNAEVYVQVDEWAFACAPHPLQAQYYPADMMAEVEAMKMRLIRGDYDLYPGIRIILTPGHTPGTQSLCVDTKEGKTVIVGQCTVHQTFMPPKELLPKGHPFSSWEVFSQSIATDMNQAYWSNAQVKSMADVLLPCHGPGFDERTKKYLPDSMK